MSQHDRHLTTEELSASLDGQLAATEQAQWDEHLKTCEECQLKLTDLRQTVALLHALPQPRLPRSFVLPTDGTVIAAHREELAPAAGLITPLATHRRERAAARSRGWPTYIQTAVRTVSTLAAMVGIVLVLAGLLSVRSYGGVTATSGGSAPMAAPAATNASSAQSSSGSAQQNQANKAPSATPTAQAFAPNAAQTAQPTPTLENPGKQQPQVTSGHESTLPALLDLNTVAGRTGLGFLLLVLSIVGFVLLARQRKHANEG